jgi:hypothetical protein
MVVCGRRSILFTENVIDAFGHVSVRQSENLGHYLIARALPPKLNTAGEIKIICERLANAKPNEVL